jgi:hypothetical protein
VLIEYISKRNGTGFTKSTFAKVLGADFGEIAGHSPLLRNETQFGINSDQIRQAIINFKTMQKQWITPAMFDTSDRQLKEVLLHGEQRSAETEEGRRLHLMFQSERERAGKNIMKKIWKRLVTFKGAFAPKDFVLYSQDER